MMMIQSTGVRMVRGFTLIELIVALAVFGILSFSAVPGILNTLEVRALDGAAEDVLSALQSARWQSASTKLSHRVRFHAVGSWWAYSVERENPAGTWTPLKGLDSRRLPPKFTVTLNLPTSNAVVYAQTGFISGYDGAHNEISLSSAKLRGLGQEDRRIIRFYASGSVRFIKDTGS
jgi:prepilin-type N-terminal cleavage/methylation domain-containing protein